MVSSSNLLVRWCQPHRRSMRRRRGSTIRLGSQRRRGFFLGTRRAVRWGLVTAPLRMLKKMVMKLASPTATAAGYADLEAYYRNFPFLRPQIFPLC
ncbi:hypothetical protein LINGRAHAP2_LOCUS7583 [Linum grandiflorum]